MSSENSRVTVPAELPPEAPPEVLARRDPLIQELDAAAKTAKGALQQVLRLMGQLIVNTKPGASVDGQLYQAVRDAFIRYEKEAGSAPWPPVLVQSVEWMQTYLASRGFAVPEAAGSPLAAVTAAPRTGKDAFEATARKGPSLTGDTPVAPAAQQPTTEQQKQDALKTWMMNRDLGKVRG